MMNEKVENLSRHQDGKIGFFIIDYPLLGDAIIRRKKIAPERKSLSPKLR
jgi:hypothetical protein